MRNILSEEYYGNTIADWLLSLTVILGAYLISKIIYWIFKHWILRLVKGTKSKLDDIIIDMVEEPIMFGVVLAGFWYGIILLNIPENFNSFIDRVFYIAVTFDVAWLITRLVDALVFELLSPLVEKSESKLDDQLLPILRKSIKVVIWTIAIVVGLNNAGYDVGTIIAGLGLGGLAFAMAAKDSVSNLFGGITVFTDKPFKINDRIVIDGYDGIIQEIGIRSTRLKTLAGRIVTIPNKKFTDSYIENISSEPWRRITLKLGLAYETSPEMVQKALNLVKEINSKNENTEDNCIVWFESFGDYSLNISVMYYIKLGQDFYNVQSEINSAILAAFNKNGLEFAYPTHSIINKN